MKKFTHFYFTIQNLITLIILILRVFQQILNILGKNDDAEDKED